MENNGLIALFKFDVSVLIPDDSIYIASKLDADESMQGCRIAFHGTVLEVVENGDNFQKTTLKVFKRKQKIGVIDRVVSDNEAICKNLFKGNFDMNKLNGFKVIRECDGAVGEIRGNFGSAKNAKFKAYFRDGGLDSLTDQQSKRIIFHFVKYFADNQKKWLQ